VTAAPVHQHTHQIRIVNLNPKSTGKMSCEEGLDGSLATLFAQAVVSNSNRDDDGLRVNHLKLTPAAVVERVYFLGRIISNVFEETNLHYWTSGGTTLGAMRHRGLIPWDDDLDLCILKENMHFFLNEVAPKLHGEHGVVCQETCFGYRLFHRTNSDAIASQINHRHPFCDVFVMRRTQGSWRIILWLSVLLQRPGVCTQRNVIPSETLPNQFWFRLGTSISGCLPTQNST